MQNNEQVVHGALDFAELAQLGLAPEDICDFSVNSNPYGPPPSVAKALAQVRIEQYPDRQCLQLRQALIQHEIQLDGIAQEMVLCGNGATDLIWAIARAYLSLGQKAAVIEPTFGEYRYASQATGAQVISFQTALDNTFALDIDTLTNWLLRESPRATQMSYHHARVDDVLTTGDV